MLNGNYKEGIYISQTTNLTILLQKFNILDIKEGYYSFEVNVICLIITKN